MVSVVQVVESMKPQDVFEKLQQSIGRINTATEDKNRTMVGLGR